MTPPLDAAALSPWGLTGVTIGGARTTFPGRAVYTVESDQGAFAAKVGPARPWGPSGDRLGVLDVLQAHAFPHSPRLQRARDGRASVIVGDSRVTLLEFVPRPLHRDASDRASSWFELGAAAAALNAFDDYPTPFAVPVDEALAQLRERAADTRFERPFGAALDRASQLTECSRAGLIHGEINEANALRRDDGVVVLVDWDQAGTGPVALEVGYPLIVAFVEEETHRVDEARARSFYDGYRRVGALEVSTAFAAAVFHALRYLWFGDTEKRWERVSWALRNEGDLVGLLAG